MSKNNTKEILIIAIKLLVICSVVATIVASVNYITKDRIAFNEMLNTAEALTGIYKEDYNAPFSVDEGGFVIKDGDNTVISCTEEQFTFTSKDVKAIYVLRDSDGSSVGYCVSVQPMGFKDYIKMLVAVNPDCTVKGVEIVSMSETSGIGTKAKDKSFIEQFISLDETAVKRDVDTIAGATKTTRPVIDAVAASLYEVSEYIHVNGGVSK